MRSGKACRSLAVIRKKPPGFVLEGSAGSVGTVLAYVGGAEQTTKRLPSCSISVSGVTVGDDHTLSRSASGSQSNMSWIMLFLVAFAKAWPISSAMPILCNDA